MLWAYPDKATRLGEIRQLNHCPRTMPPRSTPAREQDALAGPYDATSSPMPHSRASLEIPASSNKVLILLSHVPPPS